MTLTTVTSRATAALVAAVAGFASYRHIYDVAITHGEHRTVAAVLPLAIDGLILVATLALLDDKRQRRHPRLSARVAMAFGILATLAANIASAQPSTAARLVAAVPAISFMLAVEVLSRTGRPVAEPVAGAAESFDSGEQSELPTEQQERLAPESNDSGEPVGEPVANATRREPVGEPVREPVALVITGDNLPDSRRGTAAEPVPEPVREPKANALENDSSPELREPVAEPVRERVTPRALTTAARVTAAHHRHPDATHDRLAELAGVSVATIKRHRPARGVTSSPSGPHAAETRVNGTPVEVS